MIFVDSSVSRKGREGRDPGPYLTPLQSYGHQRNASSADIMPWNLVILAPFLVAWMYNRSNVAVFGPVDGAEIVAVRL